MNANRDIGEATVWTQYLTLRVPGRLVTGSSEQDHHVLDGRDDLGEGQVLSEFFIRSFINISNKHFNHNKTKTKNYFFSAITLCVSEHTVSTLLGSLLC